MKCSKPNCSEAKMPKMIILKLDSQNSRFKIIPNIKLQKHFIDWPQRIKVSLENMVYSKDFTVKYNIISIYMNKNRK